VLFVGLGVDFGIQFSVRYRSERFKNDEFGAGAGERRAARGGAAFAGGDGHRRRLPVLLPTDYKGISNWGKIAGAGMLVAFLTSITNIAGAARLLNPPGEKRAGRLSFLAPVDEFLEKQSRRHHRRQRSWSRSPACRCSIHEVSTSKKPDQPAQQERRVDRDVPQPCARTPTRVPTPINVMTIRKPTPRR